jgi:hypothetical protein
MVICKNDFFFSIRKITATNYELIVSRSHNLPQSANFVILSNDKCFKRNTI